jgi:hypothetical protein
MADPGKKVRLMTGDAMTLEVVSVAALTCRTRPIDMAELRILLIRSGISPVTPGDAMASDIDSCGDGTVYAEIEDIDIEWELT